jgi:hypothetical protein
VARDKADLVILGLTVLDGLGMIGLTDFDLHAPDAAREFRLGAKVSRHLH